MPAISMFYGIIIYMYYSGNKQHSTPHIHAEYQDKSAVFSISDGDMLAGEFPPKKVKLVQAWIEIRCEELLANWKLAVTGKTVFRIEPLR
jgi:hypothetical protein